MIQQRSASFKCVLSNYRILNKVWPKPTTTTTKNTKKKKKKSAAISIREREVGGSRQGVSQSPRHCLGLVRRLCKYQPEVLRAWRAL